MDENEKVEILEDIRNGKKTKWKGKKIASLQLAEVYYRLGMIYRSKADRVLGCSDYLEFNIYKDGTKKLSRANFCKVRLCPMCSWRRSIKWFNQVSKVMDVAEERGYNFLFLTLTVKNCEAGELRDTIDLLLNGYNKGLKRNEDFKKAIKGSFRALEVTYNKKSKMYHPHLHIILAVEKDYFTDARLYISQEEFTKMWKKAIKVDYTPIVDIRKVKNLKSSKKGQGAIKELTKYTVKETDFLGKDLTDKDKEKVVVDLDGGLRDRRLVAYSGVLDKIAKELKVNPEDDNLIIVDDEVREDVAYMVEKYCWNFGCTNYVKVKEKNKGIGKSSFLFSNPNRGKFSLEFLQLKYGSSQGKI